MAYTLLDRGICPDCAGEMVQLALGADVNGEDDFAGVGWFHVTARTTVQELCPFTGARSDGRPLDHAD